MTKHTHCTSCGTKFGGVFGRYDVGNGLCIPCDAKRYDIENGTPEETAQAVELSAIIVTTEAAPTGLAIESRLGLVSGDAAFGLSILKDIMIGARDLVGGRSVSMQKAIKDGRAAALADLRSEALKLGANAVIAVTFSVTDVGSTGSSMLLVTATGTAVLVS